MLIRAHGEPPTTYALAAAHRIRLIDATCPVVARLQTLVKKAHEQMSGCNGQVVILGKRGHAEVVGLTGQVDGDAIVIETLDDLDNIDFTRPVYLLSANTAKPCPVRRGAPNHPGTLRRPVAGDRQRYDLPAGFEPEPAPKSLSGGSTS